MGLDDKGIVVLDNGGYNIKAGYVSAEERSRGCDVQSLSSPPEIFPNAVAKPPKKSSSVATKRNGGFLVSAELYDLPSYSGLFFRRPIERGYVKEWDLQRDVWKYIFTRSKVEPKENCFVVTEPIALPGSLRRGMDELVFEEFGFASYYSAPPAALVARHFDITDGLVLDSGFSFSHAVPILNSGAQQQYSRRLDLGGKVLTNQLKEVVSFRSWNMMDEFLVINAAKEELCYVAQDFLAELEDTRLPLSEGNKTMIDYVLPTHASDKENRFGYSRPSVPKRAKGDPSQQEQPTLTLNNERISIPEALFHPSDLGLHQGGLHEVIAESIAALPRQLQGRIYNNIVLSGGNCKFPGFEKRLTAELRALAPEEYDLALTMDKDPELSAVKGVRSWFQLS
mmetsp:Transcript_15382/g.62734  ORF Transcript_15382/g.62734 Transcript_15382/m.62734 type:complete len:396 (-) Transcript_15382:952-2139(-)